MSVLGIGVDLVEVARIQHSVDRFGERFLHRVFTDGEIEYSTSMKFPARHLAARFAAKERGVVSALITLSHTDHHAMAMIVLES